MRDVSDVEEVACSSCTAKRSKDSGQWPVGVWRMEEEEEEEEFKKACRDEWWPGCRRRQRESSQSQQRTDERAMVSW